MVSSWRRNIMPSPGPMMSFSIIASIVIWFTQGGTEAGERFGIFIGLWAPTFMSIGNGIDNLKD